MGQDKILSQEFSMEENSYDDEKQDRKQKLVRNEFKTVGKYDIPLVKRQNIDTDKIAHWGYVKAIEKLLIIPFDINCGDNL